jgi:hypothetical protein
MNLMKLAQVPSIDLETLGTVRLIRVLVAISLSKICRVPQTTQGTANHDETLFR